MRFYFCYTKSDPLFGDCRMRSRIIIRTFHHPFRLRIRIMNIDDIFPIRNLTVLQKVLCVLSLVLPWAGIGFSYTLHSMVIMENEGSFIWGCVLGSFVLAGLALLFEKKDIVSIMTPIYALIIFFSMEIPWTILLQVLYSCTLTILLWRLLTRYGPSNAMQHA